MIFLKKDHLEEIINYSELEEPNESCGLLGGTIDGNNKIIHKVYKLQNIDRSPEHFSMDVKEQFQTILDIRKNNWQLIGNFHSHTLSQAKPSDEDIRLAFDSSLSYFIISLQDKENPVLNSFKIKDKIVSKEEITILE